MAEWNFSIDPGRPVACWFTIWPNVFTNQLYIYPSEHWPHPKQLMNFQPAAQHNRARLRASLHAWERLSEGQIVTWESYLVEHGVGRYGFAEDAIPF